jgi:hypothetical protein
MNMLPPSSEQKKTLKMVIALGINRTIIWYCEKIATFWGLNLLLQSLLHGLVTIRKCMKGSVMKCTQQEAIRKFAIQITQKAWGPKTEIGKKIRSKLNIPHQEHRNHWCGITQSVSWECWEAMILITEYGLEENRFVPLSVCHVPLYFGK